MDKQTQLFQLERQEMRDSKQLRINEAKDRKDQRAERQAKSVAISITEDTFRKQVRFAWIDGIFWERWLRSTFGVDITSGERVIINDEEVSQPDMLLECRTMLTFDHRTVASGTSPKQATTSHLLESVSSKH